MIQGTNIIFDDGLALNILEPGNLATVSPASYAHIYRVKWCLGAYFRNSKLIGKNNPSAPI